MADSPRIEELKRRVQADPASIAFAALAEEYRRAGRFEEAIAASRSGLQRHPSYISAHVTLGRALLEVGDYEEAREELELVLRVAPENLAAIRGLAEIHHRRGDVSETQDEPAEQAPDTASVAGAPAVGAWANPPAATAASDYPGPATAAVPPQMEQLGDPALAGLEDFLGAILRARGVRSS